MHILQDVYLNLKNIEICSRTDVTRSVKVDKLSYFTQYLYILQKKIIIANLLSLLLFIRNLIYLTTKQN